MTDALAEAPGPGNFAAKEEQEGLFCDFEMVLAAIDDEQRAIIDARAAGRFYGTAPEPRPGVRGGAYAFRPQSAFYRRARGRSVAPAGGASKTVS